MFKEIGNFANMLKQAQQVSSQMQSVSEELKRQTVTGAAGGGLVEVDASGVGEVLAVRVDPKLIEQQDRELLEDLLAAAVNQALAKARQLHADSLKSLTGGMNMPGLDEAIAKFTPTPDS
ncbi:MAG: YbaB/EbfC family nucleoid-associated protein [Pirellulales bacterium]